MVEWADTNRSGLAPHATNPRSILKQSDKKYTLGEVATEVELLLQKSFGYTLFCDLTNGRELSEIRTRMNKYGVKLALAGNRVTPLRGHGLPS